jgi:serine protease Do
MNTRAASFVPEYWAPFDVYCSKYLVHSMKRIFLLLVTVFLTASQAQEDPSQEPAVRAVAKTMPAVVNINTESVIRRQVRNSFDAFFDEYYGGQMRPPRFIKQKVQSLGSGFFVDASGYIVTNAHVVERAAEMKISVTTPDGKTYVAKYVAGDPDHDLALIKVEGTHPFPFISLNDPSPNHLGQTCLVLGNPLGYGSSVARGILSAKGRSVTVGETEFQNLLQTDAAINPGNSGGPIVDIGGKLTGISSVKMSYTPQGIPTQGLGFAIPASVVREKVEELRKVARGEKLPDRPSLARKFFGLVLSDVDEKVAANHGYREGSGALVEEVEPDSSAAKAGVVPGMLVSGIGRFDVTGVRQVEKLFAQIDSGSRVDFGIAWWQGKTRQRLVTDTFQLTAK